MRVCSSHVVFFFSITIIPQKFCHFACKMLDLLDVVCVHADEGRGNHTQPGRWSHMRQESVWKKQWP